VGAHTCRDPALCQRDLEQYRDRNRHLFPIPPRDLTPGEERLAAEVALAVMRFEMVPRRARELAIEALTAMAGR
jgi:hypothetical protein